MIEYYVVDGFYSQPDVIRNLALKSKYFSTEQSGRESVKCFYSPSLVKRIEKIIGTPIEVDPIHNAFGVFNISSAKERSKRHVHTDQTEWTAIVYLSPDSMSKGGTSFFEHLPTGLRTVPSSKYLSAIGFASREQFHAEIIAPDQRNSAKWKVWEQVSMKYNRLLVFRSGSMFHSADERFGTTLENSRVVQLFFFNTKRTQNLGIEVGKRYDFKV